MNINTIKTVVGTAVATVGFIYVASERQYVKMLEKMHEQDVEAEKKYRMIIDLKNEVIAKLIEEINELKDSKTEDEQ